MNATHLALVIALAGGACSSRNDRREQAAPEGSGATAAAAAPRYSQQKVLPRLPALALPDDPKRAEKIALGHALFFDKRLSGNNDRACYSCHMNENGNGGKDPIAVGSGDKVLTRHSPVIWNVGYWVNAFYWDGRAPSLEANVKGAWGGGNMGAGADKLDAKAAEIAAIAGYQPMFAAAFGATEIKADQVASAIAEYMRSLVCGETRYDRFAAGDRAALSDQEQRGLDVFAGRGACVTCHAPPFFSTAMGVDGGVYFNVGIGTQVAEDKVDVGRMAVTKDPRDWARFKPPSLRNVSRSAPYFHDGSVATLEESVRLMAGGGIPNKNLEQGLLADRKLTDPEVKDLVAFLSALECGALVEPKLP